MIVKSTIYNALEKYYIYLQIDGNQYKKSELNSAKRCMEYIENGGQETAEWLCDNIFVLSSAAEYYHKLLDEDIKEAKIIGDEVKSANLCEERKQLLKYITYFKLIKEKLEI